MKKNIFKHTFSIERKERNKLNGHQSFVLWFTGLSGSGKSTIANAVEVALHKLDMCAYTLDGDNIRKGLNNDLSFSPDDRKENIRRIAEVSNLMIDAGLVVLAAFVSPYRKDRENIKSIVGEANFFEIFVDTPIEECEKRDVKGLYAKARTGEIHNFTGVNAPYEKPLQPHITLNTSILSIEESVDIVIEFIKRNVINDE